ncbi:MAG: hypothetical protein KAT68_10720 [Bacteroidales bacterium]|nr:hypothetical protein [Bacteroidales bacterium]
MTKNETNNEISKNKEIKEIKEIKEKFEEKLEKDISKLKNRFIQLASLLVALLVIGFFLTTQKAKKDINDDVINLQYKIIELTATLQNAIDYAYQSKAKIDTAYQDVNKAKKIITSTTDDLIESKQDVKEYRKELDKFDKSLKEKELELNSTQKEFLKVKKEFNKSINDFKKELERLEMEMEKLKTK